MVYIRLYIIKNICWKMKYSQLLQVNTCYYEEISKTYSILIVKFNNKKFENGIS